jgi:hypothetical protein
MHVLLTLTFIHPFIHGLLILPLKHSSIHSSMDSSVQPIHPIHPWTPHFTPQAFIHSFIHGLFISAHPPHSSMDSSFYPVNIHSYHSSIGSPSPRFFFPHPLHSFWTPYSTTYSFIDSSMDSLLAPLFYSSFHSFIHPSIHPSIPSVESLTLESQTQTFVLRRQGSFWNNFFLWVRVQAKQFDHPLDV